MTSEQEYIGLEKCELNNDDMMVTVLSANTQNKKHWCKKLHSSEKLHVSLTFSFNFVVFHFFFCFKNTHDSMIFFSLYRIVLL